MPFRFPRLAVAFVALVALFGPGAAAHAETAEEDTQTTWMVRPSDGEKEDGRSWIDTELDPGDTVEEHMLVRNLSRETVTFSLVAADGYFTDTGRFNMQTSNTTPSDAGAWIDMQPSVEVASGADAIVPFTLAVPSDATPGDHIAGVAATIRSGGDDQVGIESRVGFRVMVRVAGEIAPAAEATISGVHRTSWNPFEPGAASVTYAVTNTGNANLSISPDVRLSGVLGAVSPAAPAVDIDTLAPGESRAFTVEFPSAWPLFLYSAEMTAAATPVGGGVGVEPLDVSAQTTVWALSWSQAAVLLVLIALGFWLWTDRRGRDRRIAELERQVDERPVAAPTDRQAGSVVRRSAGPTIAILSLILLLGAPVAGATASSQTDGNGITVTVEVSDKNPTPAEPGDPGGAGSPGGSGLADTGAAPAWAALWVAVGLIAGGIALQRLRRVAA